ncbi:MAG: SLOG family protein [Bacteroidales bacterium]
MKRIKYKLAVVGSRDFSNYEKLSYILDSIRNMYEITHIVSGGARGADKLGELYASHHGIPTIIFTPDWDKYGKAAGFIRNNDIIKASDIVLACWDGISKGTEHSMNISKDTGKPLLVYNYITDKLFLYK